MIKLFKKNNKEEKEFKIGAVERVFNKGIYGSYCAACAVESGIGTIKGKMSDVVKKHKKDENTETTEVKENTEEAKDDAEVVINAEDVKKEVTEEDLNEAFKKAEEKAQQGQ